MAKPSAAEAVGTRLQMPFLLMCGMGFTMFFACLAVLAFVVLVVMLPFSGSYSIDGHAVSRAEFLAREWPLLVAWPILAGGIVSIAYALWKELPWSRPVMMAFVLLDSVAGIVVSIVHGTKDDPYPHVSSRSFSWPRQVGTSIGNARS